MCHIELMFLFLHLNPLFAIALQKPAISQILVGNYYRFPTPSQPRMNNSSEAPIDLLNRLTNHSSLIARRLTEISDVLTKLAPYITVALIVWIAFPIVVSLFLLWLVLSAP